MIFLQYAGDETPKKFDPKDPDNFRVKEFDNPFQALQFYMDKNSDICSVTTGFKVSVKIYVVRQFEIREFAYFYFDASDYETVRFHMIADIKLNG